MTNGMKRKHLRNRKRNQTNDFKEIIKKYILFHNRIQAIPCNNFLTCLIALIHILNGSFSVISAIIICFLLNIFNGMHDKTLKFLFFKFKNIAISSFY